MRASVKVSVELVTPAIAEKWLNANKTNRKLRPGRAEQYAADMIACRWTECIAPIAFYDDGDLADGQHRLWAIVDSGIAQTFTIHRGLSREAGLNIDTGLGRSLVDNAHISGTDDTLSNNLISLARAIEQGDHAGNIKAVSRKTGKVMKPILSNSERMMLVVKHREAADWAIENGPRGKLLRNALIQASMARAYMHEPNRERLKRFAEVLSTGFYEKPDETAAVAIRTYLLKAGPAASIATNWRDTFIKVQHAIWMFMRGRPMSVTKPVGEEDYPLKNAAHSKATRAGKMGKTSGA